MTAAIVPVPASLSTAERAHVCPGSTALDRVDSLGGESGSATHEALAYLIPFGRDEMEDELDEIFTRWDIDEREAGFIRARLAKFSPQIPKRDDGEDVEPALTEVSLCLCEGRGVVEVYGGQGRYAMPDGGMLPGSIDAMWSEPEPLRVDDCEHCGGSGVEPGDDGCRACNRAGRRYRCPPGSTLWVIDFKCGADRNVQRAERNRQIRWGAALAARWTGAERVVAAIVYVEGTEGRWDYRQHPAAWPGAPPKARPYERWELELIEDEILADHARWKDQRRRREAGEALELTTGAHCEHCPSRAYCPAHVQPARALVAVDPARLASGPLTPEEAAQLAVWLPLAERAVKAAREAVETHVDAIGPIALPDGRVFGKHLQPWTKKTFATRKTFEVLAEEIGDEAADEAFSTSKDAIETAITKAHAAAGIKRQVSPTMRRVLARLYEAGAITEEPVVHIHAHHPVGALPAAAGTPAPTRGT